MPVILPDLEQLYVLKSNPGYMYVAPSGTELYVSSPMGIVMFHGTDFKSMSDEEINAYLQVQLSR